MANQLSFFRGEYSKYLALKNQGEVIETNLYFTLPDSEGNKVENDEFSSSYCLFHGVNLLACSKHEEEIKALAQQITDLENRIDNISSELATYEVVKYTEEELGELNETNVKEAYKLVKTQGEVSEQVGETIKIYKDSALQSVVLSGESLDFTYLLADGTEETVSVDVSKFLSETEFKEGLQVNANGEVSVKVAEAVVSAQTPTKATSKNFLNVDENGLAVKSIDTDATVLQKEIKVAGLSSQFGAGNYQNNDTIAAGTDIYTILQNILCKELYATPSYVTGSTSASIAKPTITLDITGDVEVGTLITMTTATVGESSIKTTGHSVSNLEYGYSLQDDDTQDYSAKTITTSWTTGRTGNDYKMVAALTGFTADATTYKQNTPATVSARTMNETVLGCAIEGSNTIKVNVTGDTFTSSIDGIDAVYHCSNLGNTDSGKVTTEIVAITDKESNAPTSNHSVTVTGKYKYFMGYSENTLFNQFDSASVRALTEKSSWVAQDATTTIVGDEAIKSNGKSIVIACPSKYKLATIKNGVGADIMENFTTKGSQGVVSVKCGEINVDYNVYVYPITNNAVVEFKNVTLTK